MGEIYTTLVGTSLDGFRDRTWNRLMIALRVREPVGIDIADGQAKYRREKRYDYYRPLNSD